MERYKLSDEKYHSIGGFNLQEPDLSIVSASLLKRVFDIGLYEALLEPVETNEELEEIFKAGRITHQYFLERDEFDKSYYIGNYNPIDDREKMDNELSEFLLKTEKEIMLKYPTLLEQGENEISFLGEIDGVAVKSKMDKVIFNGDTIEIVDFKTTYLPLEKLKKTPQGKAWELDREAINSKGVDLQMYFYKRVIEEYCLIKKGVIPQINTTLVFLSKADFKVRKIRLSEEILGRGEEKFKSIWGEVQDFVKGGISNINDFDII